MAKTTKINIGGTWKVPDSIKINVASTWKVPDSVKINEAGVWKRVWPPVSVSPSSSNVTKSADTAPCYASLAFSNDGNEYTNGTATTESAGSFRNQWLDTGPFSSNEVWIQRTINSGALWTDPGSGRLNLGTSRLFSCYDTDPTAARDTAGQCNITFDFYDAATGGSPIASVTITMSAQYLDLGGP